MRQLLRSRAIPLSVLLLLVAAVAVADSPVGINGEHEAPIIEKIQEAIKLEEDAKSTLGSDPTPADRSLASGKLDDAVMKIKERWR